jgi:hypothetical protein
MGTPNPVTGQNIPARQRFFPVASFSICGEELPTLIKDVQPGDCVIFPNPVYDRLIIHSGHKTVKRIVLQDVFGKPVMQCWPDENNKTELDVRLLSPGIYFITLQGAEGIFFSDKMVKM